MIDLTMLVANELARIFPEAVIYTENQSSGFDVPSFYISRAGNTTVVPRLFKTQERTYSYQIVYFADPKRPNTDLEERQEILSDNFINLADQATVKNRDFHLNTNEQTLVFTFDVMLRMMKPDLDPKQERLDINAGTKEE